jgi:hypothetical protein
MEAIYNPFKRLRGGSALSVGLLVLMALGLASWAGGLHLDGALDMHYNPQAEPSATQVAVESVVAWFSLAVCLWLAGLLVGSGRRSPLDYLGMTAVARWPYIPMALLSSKWALGKFLGRLIEVLPNETFRMHPEAAMSPEFLVLMLAVMLFTAWGITLLVFAFKEASQTTGWRLTIGVIGGLLLAEVVSKLALAAFLR